MALKLTAPQEDLLRRSTTKFGAYAVRHYRPLIKLLRESLVDDGVGGKGGPLTTRWFATEAGKKWLQEHDAP